MARETSFLATLLVAFVVFLTSPHLRPTVGARLGSTVPAPPRIDVKCGRSGMNVVVEFAQPFPGIIYSKGYYDNDECRYVTEKSAGKNTYTFLIPIVGCGTEGQLEEPQPGRDMFFENTIIVQMDPLITEAWDKARRLRCTWPHTLLRRVKASPFAVYAPQRVSLQLDERSINTLMEIQQGPGPFSKPATGYLYKGEDTSIVIYVQDRDGSVDANVVNCSASTVTGDAVRLLDDSGCLLRPDLMTTFDKTRHTNGVEADLMLYSYLKAFRIGERPEFSIRCQLEVCRGRCAPPCAIDGPQTPRRRRRGVSKEVEERVLEWLGEAFQEEKTMMHEAVALSVASQGIADQPLRSMPDSLVTSNRSDTLNKFDTSNKSDMPNRLDMSTIANTFETPRMLDNGSDTVTNILESSEPAWVVDLEQAVLIVERQPLEEPTACGELPRSVLVAGLGLLMVIAGLSLLSCTLAVKLVRRTSDKC